MDAARIRRYSRQIALSDIGPEGQARLDAARAVVAGDGLLAETAARYLAATGVGRLCLMGRQSPPSELLDAVRESNPTIKLETRGWPSDGREWLEAISGAAVVLRSAFDDDPMLRAAVRLGIPVVVARGRLDGAQVVSFRRHGPCPHAPLEVPERASQFPMEDDAGAVVAATLAAAEAVQVIAASGPLEPRARQLTVPLDGSEPVTQEIPWTPECFACGGSGTEMAFT